MSENKYQKIVYQILFDYPVLYNPGIAKVLGSVKAGVLMCQLLYWYDKGRNKTWIYKTASEIYDETALSLKEQRTAIRHCTSAGVLEVKLAGIPPKRNFKINVDKLIALIETSEHGK